MNQLTEEPPLMVQRDMTVMLETNHPEFEFVRETLSRFADMVKSPLHLHTYRITPLALWNAASTGMDAHGIVAFLESYARFGVPQTVKREIRQTIGKVGLLRLVSEEGKLLLVSKNAEVLGALLELPSLQTYVKNRPDELRAEIRLSERGRLKQELTRLGYPVEDGAGYQSGESLPVRLRSLLPDGRPFILRDYQQQALEAFVAPGKQDGGSGVLVLPCGAGKTVIGLAVIERFGCETLILTTNVTSVRQWMRELLDKTGLTPDLVGEYSGEKKEVKPVTVATYQILTHRKTKNDPFAHMQLFNRRNWGLIIYDEVHLLPAPVFRVTADIQAKRRLGLTATLVREDGCEEDVYSLIGPKRYEASWKRLEAEGYIAAVQCTEIRVPMERPLRERYAAAAGKDKLRIASENPLKLEIAARLLERHGDERALVIGQYLDQLHQAADRLSAPLISGEMPHDERERLFDAFRKGELRRLVVSKVANFAVDLPDAAVAVQISGSYGSRQEEAQRIGRILRPKPGGNRAHYYTLVSEDSNEQEYAMNRQLFLLEQGYVYRLEDAQASLLEEVQA